MTAYTAGTEGEDATVAGRDFSQLEDLVVSMLTLGEAAAFFRNTAPHHVHGDCLKLAPCTLPKSKEAWQCPTHKPTGVRKQQRAAKKKRRK